MNVFLTGGSGLLGSALLRRIPESTNVRALLHDNHYAADGTPATFCHGDITNASVVSKLFTQRPPHAVIHTAAIASPDVCQKQPKRAHEVNVVGTKNILRAASKHGAYVYAMSTNQVFSGTAPPYHESDATSPVNVYGRTKVDAEKEIITHFSKRCTILRLMTMYGWNNPKRQKNTATWVIDALGRGAHIKVVDDVFNNMLWAGQAADTIWELVTRSRRPDILHIAGASTISRFDFACSVARTFGLDASLIEAVPKSYFTDEAPRPLNTVYSIKKLRKISVTKVRSVREGLSEMKNEQKKLHWKNA